ncbi:2384_t:CDS:1, partial [Racocetra fulgida]
VNKIDTNDDDVDNTNLKNTDVDEAFAGKATKAEDVTDDFKASVNGVGLDKIDILHLLNITP